MKYLLTLTLALAGVASAQMTQPVQATPTEKPAALALVGEEMISTEQFDRAFRQTVARMLNAQGVPFHADLLGQFSNLRAEFLKQYLKDRALYQLASKELTIDENKVERRIAEIKEELKDEETFKKALTDAGFEDEQDLRKALQEEDVTSTYLSNLENKFKFGDAVVAGYYRSQEKSFVREAEACARHILVETEKEATDVVTKINMGESFDKLAKELSKDKGSGAQGGDLGCFGRGRMVPTFDKASFEGPLNKLQTVKSQFGWHVVEVTKRHQAGTLSLEEAAPLIRQKLSRIAAQKYLDSQLGLLKTEVYENFDKNTNEMNSEDKKN